MVCLVPQSAFCDFRNWQQRQRQRQQHVLLSSSCTPGLRDRILLLHVSNQQASGVSWRRGHEGLRWRDDAAAPRNPDSTRPHLRYSRYRMNCGAAVPKKNFPGDGPPRNGLETRLLQRLSQTLAEKHLLRPRQSILLATSGGQDSACLMHLLAKLQNAWGWKIGVAHCDHQWNPSSAREQASHVARMAQNLGFDYYQALATRPVRGEGVARTWRYGILQRIALTHNYEAILTAHTATDRIETLLFNVFRGTGVRGLQSLTWIQSLNSDLAVAPRQSAFRLSERISSVEDPREGAVANIGPKRLDLVRPLLNVTRTELRQLREELELPLWPDPSNLLLDIDRNRIRHQLLPYLRKHFNSGVDKSLARWAEILHGEEAYLDSLCDTIRRAAEVELVGGPRDQDVVRKLNLSLLRSLPVALQRRVLKQFVDAFSKRAIGFDIIERVRHACSKTSLKHRNGVKIVVPGGFYVRVCGDELIICNATSTKDAVK